MEEMEKARKVYVQKCSYDVGKAVLSPAAYYKVNMK